MIQVTFFLDDGKQTPVGSFFMPHTPRVDEFLWFQRITPQRHMVEYRIKRVAYIVKEQDTNGHCTVAAVFVDHVQTH